MNKKEKSVDRFCEWVDRYLNFEKNPKKGIFWLETMRFLCERLDNPQNHCRCIHVAGSKGKGSISRMIACILEENGLKCGIYSSPHIIDFTERICTVRGAFDDYVYEKSANEVISCVENVSSKEWPGERQPTWFELVTLFAFCCFRNAEVDFAVYEVGLGGRLDATNVLMPACCCINTIELEHTEFLGTTLEAIAKEKAGIIKPNVPVIIGTQKSNGVEELFFKIASEKKAPVLFSQKECFINNINYKTERSDFDVTMSFIMKSDLFSRNLNLNISILGEVQAQNASVACLAVKTVFPSIKEDIIEKGLEKVKLQARFEILSKVEHFNDIKAIVLDGAHTVNSVQHTMNTFVKLFGSNTMQEKAVLLFACAADKDVKAIAPFLKNHFASVFLTKPGNSKESDLAHLENAFKNAAIPYVLFEDYKKAVKTAFEKANNEHSLLLATGSFYLIAEVKKYLQAIGS